MQLDLPERILEHPGRPLVPVGSGDVEVETKRELTLDLGRREISDLLEIDVDGRPAGPATDPSAFSDDRGV